MDVLKLVVVLIAILLALHRRAPVGVTLFGAGLLTAVLYGVAPADLIAIYRSLVTSAAFLSLTAIILIITALGALLREMGALERLAAAVRSLYGGQRTAAALLPPLIGLMPMPGGALLSAPLVDSVLSTRHSPELKCAINYWFRHVVEHFMPIYPGLVVAAAMTGLTPGQIALIQIPLAVIMVILGYFFLIRRVERSADGAGPVWPALIGILQTTWPVLSIIALYAITGWSLAVCAVIGFVGLVIRAKPGREKLMIAVKTGLSYKLVLLVFGILSFQAVLDQSGAVATVQKLSTDLHFSTELIIVLVAFTSGLLTGMLAALVALSYSLLAAFLFQPEIQVNFVLLAFLAGYIGMILSPTHLCLVLTNEYFRSNLVSVYRLLIPPTVLLGLLGYLVYLSGWAVWVS
jgi:hypothetical protein